VRVCVHLAFVSDALAAVSRREAARWVYHSVGDAGQAGCGKKRTAQHDRGWGGSFALLCIVSRRKSTQCN
jgi:hypothetical protein